MKKELRTFFQSALIFLIVAISAHVNAQPVPVADIPDNSKNFFTNEGLVFFTAGNTLWKTDGTAGGTVALKSGFEFDADIAFEAVGNMVYFTDAKEPGEPYGKWKELWRTDGTSTGTVRVQLSAGYDIEILGSINSWLYYAASHVATGREVHRTDGGSPQLVIDIQSGTNSGFVQKGAEVENLIFFAADNGTNGVEPWVTDGTSFGTRMLKDINPGAGDGFVESPGADIGYFAEGNVFAHGNRFYFTGNDPAYGMEPWVSDGSTAGTILLKDTEAGAGSPGPLEFKIANDDEVYFLVYPSDDYETQADLWKTAGAPASTSFVTSVPKDHPDRNLFRIYNGKVYFFAWPLGVESHLWASDGTAGGTQEIHSTATHEGGIVFFEEVNGYLMYYGNHQGIPTPFFRSDGTAGGTEEFTRFKSEAYGMGPRNPTVINDLLFYADHDGPSSQGEADDPADSYQLMQSDASSVQSVRSLHGGTYPETFDIVNFDEKVLFTTLASTGSEKELWLYDPHGNTGYFTLVNSDTDEDIQRINDGDVLIKPDQTNFNIRYNPVTTPGSVVFELNGTKVRTETAAPYALAGDTGGNYAAWEGASPGSYVLTATPYSESGGNGTAGTPLTINFTIEGGSDPGDCTASGTILREQWNWVSGNQVSAIPENYPSYREQLSAFEGPTNHGTNYGARIRGYVCPPVTGNYTFWIASNDHSELWLSTDDHPSNKVRIAHVTGATTPRQWNKFASQKSSPVTLIAGQRYYIEALHKQGVGTDNIAVGWQLPDGTLERPIPGTRLSPASTNVLPVVQFVIPAPEQNYDAPATIAMEATAHDEDGEVVLVEFFQRSSASDPFIKLGEDDTAPYNFTWSDVEAGRYQVQVSATDDLGGTYSSILTVYVNDACTASGTIVREVWSGVEGSRVSDIPVERSPNITSELTIFEGPSNSGTHYGARIRGYICPPVTGQYVFFISSNDHSELWLSSNHAPAEKTLIASVTGATGIRHWSKYTSQRSAPMMLVQGQKYYIEVLHKQGVGSDNLAVGWQFPDGTFEGPIPGSRLSPFVAPVATTSSTNALSDEEASTYSQIHLYPNPIVSGTAELRMAGYEGVEEMIETQVEIINLTGEVVYQEQIRCGGHCDSYLMNIDQQLVPGVYMVNMLTNGVRVSKRLLVK